MKSSFGRFAPEILRHRRDPDLPGLEVRLAAYRRQAFARHIHDTWCAGLILAGATRARHGATTRLLEAGSLVLIGPGEVHACNPEPDGRLCYLMFFFGPKAVRAAVGNASNPVFCASLGRDPALARQLIDLYRVMGTATGRLDKQSFLCQALEPLFLRPDISSPRRDRRAVGQVREYLRVHYRQNVSLATLADLAGYAPSSLLRLFKREYGLPPHAYQNFLRVEQAKKLLATGLPAVQVALETGFADQSHFIRTFTPLVGATPGQYRHAFSRLVAPPRI